MNIRYSVTLEDLIAFNRFHIQHSRQLVRQRRIAGLALPLATILVAVVLAILRSDFRLLPFVVLFVVLYVLFLRRAYGKGLEKKLRRLYAEGKNKGVLGEHSLHLQDDGISRQSDVGSTTVAFRGIEKIESTPTHTFIYISALSAIVIPKERVIEGDYSEFLMHLRRKWETVPDNG